jgi:hypothetical protein
MTLLIRAALIAIVTIVTATATVSEWPQLDSLAAQKAGIRQCDARNSLRRRTARCPEPALLSVPTTQTSRPFVDRALQLYSAGDEAGAIDTFLQGLCGLGHREVLEQTLPGTLDQHVAHQTPSSRWSFLPCITVVIHSG